MEERRLFDLPENQARGQLENWMKSDEFKLEVRLLIEKVTDTDFLTISKMPTGRTQGALSSRA